MTFQAHVPVRHRTLWLAFTDPERMAHAVPGLTVDAVQPVDASAGPDGVSGDVVAGRLRFRVGSGTVTYRGTARIADAAAQDGTLDIAVDAAQVRGDGAVAGYLRVALVPDAAGGAGTTVRVVPELELSGRALEFADGALGEAAAALTTAWVAALAAALEVAGEVVVEDETVAEPEPEPEPEPEAEPETEPEAVVEQDEDETAAEPVAGVETVADRDPEPEPEPAGAGVANQDTESSARPAGPVGPAVSTAADTAPDIGADPFADDPLAPVWRGDVVKPRWPRAVAVLGVLWVLRRRRRRRRTERSH